MIIASCVVGYSSHTMPNIIEPRLLCNIHHMLQHGWQVVSRLTEFRGNHNIETTVKLRSHNFKKINEHEPQYCEVYSDQYFSSIRFKTTSNKHKND